MKFMINNVFPTPVYITRSDSDLTSDEEIQKIIKEGMVDNDYNLSSKNNYIFDENLKELKQFCEHHIKTYVKEVLAPKEELDFYITQSWLNVTKPGQQHHQHCHPNSCISGVFYVSAEEDDSITFIDHNWTLKEMIKPEIKEFTQWNSPLWFFPAIAGELVLFPSWLQHKVQPNEKATTDRISISFNTFVRGKLGNNKELTELIIT